MTPGVSGISHYMWQCPSRLMLHRLYILPAYPGDCSECCSSIHHTSRWTRPLVMSLEPVLMANPPHTWWLISPLENGRFRERERESERRSTHALHEVGLEPVGLLPVSHHLVLSPAALLLMPLDGEQVCSLAPDMKPWLSTARTVHHPQVSLNSSLLIRLDFLN